MKQTAKTVSYVLQACLWFSAALHSLRVLWDMGFVHLSKEWNL